ncbi:hypothetical protein KK083_29190 [Fulvivirgaceae bacterium PWU4]|uniref:Uncharacterized protein n=1 Tax=Chryseosolibacter histidini TaxID=2782349 RepID=A0AAP2GM91_9BACT|nr:hypothetical protein [Chryseosolibacter histidini]MBT1701004.1 hypothetical protein [Chryseosolibacter histidini]
MQYFTEAPVSLKADMQDEIIEIKLWGLYLLSTRASIYNEILEASLDHGPVEKNPQKPGRITFRFKVKEWESKIKKLLYLHRIPVIVTSNVSYYPASFTRQPQMVA